MTVEELKAVLLGREYTTPIKLGDHAVITDPAIFLRTQFVECEKWTKDIVKCPAYGRLLKFYEMTKK